ncbi:hypothetical protein DTO212C5_1237 [Paecilomyces variotii]|nr:hypothetical protein DTO212C5_1237 [Paecilomyces variotii]
MALLLYLLSLIFDRPVLDKYELALNHHFTVPIELDTVRRQAGTDEVSIQFKRALDNLWEDCVTREDWELLLTRTAAAVPEEIPRFRDALRILPTRRLVSAYNYNHEVMRDLRRPVIKIMLFLLL